MKEVILPKNPCGENGISHAMCEIYKAKLMQFFVDFLDEHIEFCKGRQLDGIQIEALKINFKSRFMSESKNGK